MIGAISFRICGPCMTRLFGKCCPNRVDIGTHSSRSNPFLRTQTKANIRQAENARNKWRQARTLQKYHTAGESVPRLSRRFNLDPRTVKRYLEITGPPDISRKKRAQPLDAYHTQVMEWEAAGDTIQVIHEKLQFMGYTAAYGTVKVFIAELRKQKRVNTPLDIEYHNRWDICWLL